MASGVWMTAEYIGGVVGYWLGLYGISFLLTWGSLACLRANMPRYLDVVVASVAVLLTRAFVYENGFVDGVVHYAGPQIACLIVFGIDARRRAVREARAAAAAAPESTDQLFLPLPEFAVARPARPAPTAPVAPPPPPPPPKKGWNPIANHWRGAYSLGVAYWVVGTLATIVMFVVMVTVYAVLALNEYWPALMFWATAFMWLFVWTLTIWSYVGVWRSANRRIQARRAIGHRPFWAGIAKLTLVLGTFLSVVNLGASVLPELAQTYQMAFKGDPILPDYSLRIMRDGSEIEITGGIKYGLTDDLLTVMKASRRIKTIHLNSDGGRVAEGLRLNKVIRDAGLNTYVSDKCASACTLAFAGGVERWIAEYAKLGFHASAAPGFSSAEGVDGDEIQSAVLVRSGFDKAFVDKALATPNADLWVPELAELQAAGVVTHVSDGSQFAISGQGGHATKEEFAERVVENRPLLALLETKYPDEFSEMIDAVFENYLDGGTVDDHKDEMNYHEYKAVIRHIRSTSDAVMVELGRLFVDELALLREKNVSRCARFGTKGGAVYKIQSSFPSELMQRYRTIGQRLIKESGAPREDDADAVKRMLAQAMDRVQPAFTSEQRALVEENDPRGRDNEAYCRAVIALYRSILEAPEADAAAMLRAKMGPSQAATPPPG